MPQAFQFNDLESPELSPAALTNLQCNILRSTGRPRSTQTFRRFANPQALKTWVANDAPTPTQSETEESVDTIVNVLFSAEALEWLGVPPEKLLRMDPAFVRGSRHADTLAKLGGNPANWGPHQASWHVVELYAHDANVDYAPAASSDYVVEYGSGFRHDGQKVDQRHEHSYGHFKILDGLSKLVYTQADYNALTPKPPGEQWTFDPRQKLSTLLVHDLLAESNEAFGSYFVFHKFHQDKAVFDERVQTIAREIVRRRGIARPDRILLPDGVFPPLGGFEGDQLAEAIRLLIFGRGTHGDTAFGAAGNDFDFHTDPKGAECPFHTHISKMNPRGRTGHPELERSKLMARRGTSYYQTKLVTPDGKGGTTSATTPGTGLLFWAAQASIGEQFEYVMEKWANSSKVDIDHNPTPDVDAVVGKDPSIQNWRNWKATTHMDFNVWGSIAMVGAEYLFAPSLEGFRMLQTLAR